MFLNFCKLVLLMLCLCLSLDVCWAKRYYITRWGACSDCGYHDSSYQWCRLGYAKNDWDYCSTEGGKSSKGKKCLDSCKFRDDTKYQWCHLVDGGWDYCSLVEDHGTTYYTTEAKTECQNYCDIELTDEFYYCRTSENVDKRCLPNADAAWNDLLAPLEPPASNLTILPGLATIQQLGEGQTLVTYVAHEPPIQSLKEKLTSAQEQEGFAAFLTWHRTHEGLPYPPRILHAGTDQCLELEEYFDHGQVTFAKIQLQLNGCNVAYTSSAAELNIETGPKAVRSGAVIRKGLQGMYERAFRRHMAAGLRASLRTKGTVWIWQEHRDANGGILTRDWESSETDS